MKRIKSMFKPAPAAPKATNDLAPRTRRSTRSSTRASSANSRRSAAGSPKGATEEGDEAETIDKQATVTAETSTEESARGTDIATSIEGPPELTETASTSGKPIGRTGTASISPKSTANRTPEAITDKPEAPPAALDQPTSMAGVQGAVPMAEDEDDMYGSTEPTAPAEASDANGDSAMKEEEAEEDDDDDEEEEESTDVSSEHTLYPSRSLHVLTHPPGRNPNHHQSAPQRNHRTHHAPRLVH